MGTQFVQKETERILERLALETKMARSMIIHQAVIDWAEARKPKPQPFNASELAGLAQEIEGTPNQGVTYRRVRTEKEIQNLILRMRAYGYTEAEISNKVAYLRGL